MVEVAKKHKLSKLKLGRINFNQDAFQAEIEGVIEGGESREVQLYKAYADSLGLPVFGSMVKVGNREMAIIGLRVGGPHKIILLRDLVTDKPYRINVKKFLAGIRRS